MKKVLAILLTLAMALSLVACGGGKADAPAQTDAPAKTEEPAKTDAPAAEGENVIKAGLILPLSGGSGSMGQINAWAATDYFNYVNENGGIKSLGGAKIVWEIRDTEGAADIAVTAAEALIADESVSFLMGTYNSGTMSAVQPVASKYNMPMMALNAVGSYCYETENECVAIVVAGDKHDYAGLVEFYKYLHENHDVNTVYCCADNSELSTNNMIMWKKAFAEAGIEMVGTETFNANASDFSTTVQKIKAADPDFLVLQGGVNDAILLTQTLDEYGVDCLTWGQGAGFTDPTYLDAVGDLAVGMTASGYYFSSALAGAGNPELAKYFADLHESERGMKVNEPWAVGLTAAMVMVDALERAGSTDRAAIAKALMETNIPEDSDINMLWRYPGGIHFEDITWDDGTVTYNQNPINSFMVAQYVDGEFKVVYPEAVAVMDVQF